MIASMVNRIRKCNETGDALVLVIGSVFLVGILVTSLLAVTINTTAKAQATRAYSQAVAAAEGGVEVLAKNLFKAGAGRLACPASGATVTGEVNYTVVKIEYRPAGSSTYTMCNPGSQIPENAEAVKIVVEGDAINKGSARNSSGNKAKIERVFERQTSSMSLGAALFAGSTIDPGNGIQSYPTSTGDGIAGDIVSYEKFTCKTAESSYYAGTVYALNGFSTDNDCLFKKDLFIKSNTTIKLTNEVIVDGNLQIEAPSVEVPNGLKVGGATVIKGNVTFGGRGGLFNGDLRVDGNVTATVPLVVKGDSLIRGNADFGGGSDKEFYGDLRIGGNLVTGNPQIYKSRLFVAGVYESNNGNSIYGGNVYLSNPKTGLKWGELGSNTVYVPYQIEGVPADQLEISESIVTNAMKGDVWDLPKLTEMDKSDEKFLFPVYTKNEGPWSGWKEMTREEFASKFVVSPSGGEGQNVFNESSCVVNTDQLVEITLDQPTVIDLTGCELSLQWAPKIVINSDHDFAIISDGFNLDAGSEGKFHVRRITEKNSDSPNQKAYLVVPAKSLNHSCSNGSMKDAKLLVNRDNTPLLQNGSLASPNDPATTFDFFLYSFGTVNLKQGNNTSPLQGQIYACDIKSETGVLHILYSPNEGTSSGLQALTTTSIRDITR